MIDPKDSIRTILSQYPSVRNVYETRHIIEDDSIDTECFCEKYAIPFFDLWMSLSNEASKIDAEKRKVEIERERARQTKIEKEKASKFRKINFKTMTKDEKALLMTSLIFLVVGGLLIYLSIAIHSFSTSIWGVIPFGMGIYLFWGFITKKEILNQKNKMKKFKDMSDEERAKLIFASILLFGGCILYFVSYYFKFGHFWEAVGAGLALTGSAEELRLRKMDDK